jgi:hypothetical protein
MEAWTRVAQTPVKKTTRGRRVKPTTLVARM